MKMHRNIVYLALWVGFIMNAGPVCADNETRVALVMKALSNPFFGSMEASAREYASLHGIALEVFGTERETDVDHQIAIVDNLIARGFRTIVIAPADSKRLVPICKKAMGKGIIVINIDNPFHKATLAEHGITIPFVGSDNRRGGALVGDYIRRKLGGKGRVIVIEGIPGVENADLRKAGFIEAVTEGSQVEIVAMESANWHTDEAFATVSSLLKKHGKVDAIFCANDAMALGALQALDIFGLAGKVLIGAYDNIEPVRHEMRYGRVHATVEQHPELMGRYGMVLAVQALADGKMPQGVTTPLDLVTYEAFDKRIALSISDTHNPFFILLQAGAQKSADLFGVRLIVADARNEDAQQLADIQSFVKQKVDTLIINPTNTDLVAPGVELANAASIPVVTVDRKSSGGVVLCHIASDNQAGGRRAAEFLVNRVGDRARVVEIEGIPGTSAAHDRGVGFNEVLSRYPGITVVDRGVGGFDRGRAKTAMEEILSRGISFDAVFAHNDQMILGVLDALEASGPSGRSVLIGFDGIPEAVAEIRGGKLTATIVQQPEKMGQMAVQSAVEGLRSEIPPPVKLVELELLRH
jgi:ribose transport system substrate-binding protein